MKFRLTACGFLIGFSLIVRCGSAQQAGPQPAPGPGLEPAPQEKSVPLSLEQRGDLFMARKMFREAIDVYRQALPQGRAFVIYNKIGIAYFNVLDFKTAKKSYDQALKLNPKYSEAQNNIGALFYTRKKYRRAVKEYQKALKLNPNSATVYSNLGTAYFARKKFDDAVKAYRQALAIDPYVFDVRGSAGTILQVRGTEEQARLHYYLAKTCAEAGLTDQALQYIRRSLEEGFKDRKKYLEEPEFTNVRDLPEFKQLMAMEIRVL